jgi:hypothetical protein
MMSSNVAVYIQTALKAVRIKNRNCSTIRKATVKSPKRLDKRIIVFWFTFKDSLDVSVIWATRIALILAD